MAGSTGYNQVRIGSAYTPTGTADSNGNTGDLAWYDSFIYIKTSAGWKRSALSTFYKQLSLGLLFTFFFLLVRGD